MRYAVVVLMALGINLSTVPIFAAPTSSGEEGTLPRVSGQDSAVDPATAERVRTRLLEWPHVSAVSVHSYGVLVKVMIPSDSQAGPRGPGTYIYESIVSGFPAEAAPKMTPYVPRRDC